jgi:hypothetical protein
MVLVDIYIISQTVNLAGPNVVNHLANHGRVKLRHGKENCSYGEWATVVGFCNQYSQTNKQKRMAWTTGSAMEIQEIHMKNILGQLETR